MTEPTTEPTPTIWTALLAVQAEAPALQRDGINPHFKNQYVKLETLVETVLPLLNKHGIVLVQSPEQDGDGKPVLDTRLVLAATGESVSSSTPLYLGKDDAQGYGSALTYGRRYALMSMLSLVADVDDDGAAAAASSERTRTGQQRREFDPGVDLAPGAIKVQTEDDANAVQQAVRDLDPAQPWPDIYAYLQAEVFGETYDEWGSNNEDNRKKREWWTRLANAVIRVGEIAGGGDFPPPTHAQIAEGFAWAFKGTVLALSERVADEEGETGEPATPDGSEPQDAS